MRRITRSIVSGLFLAATGCLEPYSIPGSGTAHNLVVDGDLNSSSGTCEVRLARVTSVEAFSSAPPEGGAEVDLLKQDGTLYSLSELMPGDYTGSALEFNEGDSVQLKIITSDNVTYESPFLPVFQAPVVDSVTTESEREGLTIKVSAHTDNPGQYYFWAFEETWNHYAAYETAVKFIIVDRLPVVVPLDEKIYECWTTANSTDILIAYPSPRSDGSHVVANFPLGTIPWESPKLQSHISIEVRQRAISKETFEFLTELKKNTENLGTLFDPLPSSPTGNIRCVTHPEEIALGNFFASTMEKKRIFLDQLNWTRPSGTRSITGNESCALNVNGPDLTLYFPIGLGVGYHYDIATKQCADCRLNGGTNVRPEYWIW